MSQIQKLSYRQFNLAKIMQFRTKQLYCQFVFNYKGYGKPCHLLTLEEQLSLIGF